MGLEQIWIHDFINALKSNGVFTELKNLTVPTLIIKDKILIRLISIFNLPNFKDLELEKESFLNKNFLVINLWQDVWINKPEQVLIRIKYFVDLNKRIHTRKCTAKEVGKPEAKKFLNKYHLQGYVKSKHAYGLFFENQLLLIACFNNLIMKSKGENYLSAELIRFCTLPEINIPGGLSKVINFYKEKIPFNDLMTYADRDWSYGHSFQKLGFNLVDKTDPVQFYINKDSFERLTEKQYLQKVNKSPDCSKDYIQVQNTGNLKYILNGIEY